MKLFIAVIIIFNGQIDPNVFTYQYAAFNKMDVCTAFLEKNNDIVEQSIEDQFPSTTIDSKMIVCMTEQEIRKLSNQTQGIKWQTQEHIYN
jgi:hypothetical protein|tara:strand:+ start:197 stop:469 length:273 start_codon:yes stop_codon:yes gene_type:complete